MKLLLPLFLVIIGLDSSAQAGREWKVTNKDVQIVSPAFSEVLWRAFLPQAREEGLHFTRGDTEKIRIADALECTRKVFPPSEYFSCVALAGKWGHSDFYKEVGSHLRMVIPESDHFPHVGDPITLANWLNQVDPSNLLIGEFGKIDLSGWGSYDRGGYDIALMTPPSRYFHRVGDSEESPGEEKEELNALLCKVDRIFSRFNHRAYMCVLSNQRPENYFRDLKGLEGTRFWPMRY